MTIFYESIKVNFVLIGSLEFGDYLVIVIWLLVFDLMQHD
jgi:hypothetical protein